MEKYNEKYEKQLYELALNRIESGNYKVFDEDARVITRTEIEGKKCLVIANREGETVVIDGHFEKALRAALEQHDKI